MDTIPALFLLIKWEIIFLYPLKYGAFKGILPPFLPVFQIINQGKPEGREKYPIYGQPQLCFPRCESNMALFTLAQYPWLGFPALTEPSIVTPFKIWGLEKEITVAVKDETACKKCGIFSNSATEHQLNKYSCGSKSVLTWGCVLLPS